MLQYQDLCYNTNCANDATFQCMNCFNLFCGKCLRKVTYILICQQCLYYIVKKHIDENIHREHLNEQE